MKRTLFIIAGTVVFAALGFVIGSVATNWYSERFAKSDADINTSVAVVLLLWPVFAGIGGYLGYLGYLGNRLYRSRNLTVSSSERAKG